ncbi:MAG: amino acid ABC transporter permease [Clostridia bacterium]|nr:amino acid ABC transporter permease [Clostridia bacterium]
MILSLKEQFILNFVEDDRWKYLTNGLLNTLTITVFALLLGVVIGIVVAMIRTTYDKTKDSLKKRNKIGYSFFFIVNSICKIYLTVIRGTPVVVQLLIAYFIIFAFSNDGIMVASIAFGINSGAYVAEILRGGIMSIDVGQFEASNSLGFNYVQTMIYVIIPQVIKTVLPTLLNEMIALIKETSIAGYVGIVDLTKGGDIIRGRTFSAFMPLLAVAAIYLVIVSFLTFVLGRVERRLRKSER